MELGRPLIPSDDVEPVWFGLVDHVEDLAFEAPGERQLGKDGSHSLA